MDKGELQGLRYRCLEDCGFCCTFTAQVEGSELSRLRSKFPELPVVRSGEMTMLALQGGCGGCTLLKNRACSAYDERPAHCRYFPFHVYFGRRTQVYVNRCCRGVEPGHGDIEREFASHVGNVVPSFRLRKLQEKADAVHRAFESNAREAGVWGDVDEAIQTQTAKGAAWFDWASWPPTQSGRRDEAGSPEEAFEVALAAFSLDDPVARPYHLSAGLDWFGFQGDAQGIKQQRLHEDGTLEDVRDLGSVDARLDLPAPVRVGLAAELQRLAGRDLLAGTVFHLVDDADYQVTVADATRIRFGDMAAALAVRAALLHRMGVPWSDVPAEASRFYDSAFLDHPTIGGWL